MSGRRAAWCILAVTLALAAVACSGGGDSGNASDSDTTPLVGTNWILTDSPSLGAGLTVNDVSAQFSDKRVSGSSGCNSYDTAYTTDGSKMTIDPNIVSTKRACEAGPTAVESAYLARLVKVTSFAIENRTLSLFGKGDERLLVYRSSGAQRAIVGAWSVTNYYTGSAVQSVLIGTELTAEFTSKEVTGNGGCNTFGGPYKATGNTISIGPIASTLILCADQTVNAQEQQYFAALELARSYRVTQNRLELLREGGTTAVTFERTP